MTNKPISEMTDQETVWLNLVFYNYVQFQPSENGEYLVFYRTDSNIKHSSEMMSAIFENGRWKWDDCDVLFWAHKVDRNEVIHG